MAAGTQSNPYEQDKQLPLTQEQLEIIEAEKQKREANDKERSIRTTERCMEPLSPAEILAAGGEKFKASYQQHFFNQLNIFYAPNAQKDKKKEDVKKASLEASKGATGEVPSLKPKQKTEPVQKTSPEKSHEKTPEAQHRSNEDLYVAIDTGSEKVREGQEREKATNKLSLVREVALVYGTYLEDLRSRVRAAALHGSVIESYNTQIKLINDLLTTSTDVKSMDSKAISKKANEMIAKAFKSEYLVSNTPRIGGDIEGVGKDIGVDKKLLPKVTDLSFDSEKQSEQDFARIREILSSSATHNPNELLSKKVQALSLLRIHDVHDSDPRVLNSSDAMRSILEGDFLSMNEFSKSPKIAESFANIAKLKINPEAKKEFFAFVFPEGTVPEINTKNLSAFLNAHGVKMSEAHLEAVAQELSGLREANLRAYQEILGKEVKVDLAKVSQLIKSNPQQLSGGEDGCMGTLSRSLIKKTMQENFESFQEISKKNPLTKLYMNIEGLQASETDSRNEKGLLASLRSMGSGYLSDERLNSDAKYQQDIAEQVLIMAGVGRIVGSASKIIGTTLAERFGTGLVRNEMASVGDFVSSKLISRMEAAKLSTGVTVVAGTGARLVAETVTEGGAFAIGYTQLNNLIGNTSWETGMTAKELGRITFFLGVIKSLHIGVDIVKSALGKVGSSSPEMAKLVESKGISDPTVMSAVTKELGSLGKSVEKIPGIREGAGIIADTTTLVIADTIVRVVWKQDTPGLKEGQNWMEYAQGELEAIVPLVIGLRQMEKAKGPIDVTLRKDGGIDVSLDGQIIAISKEQRRLIQTRNIARRDGDKTTVGNINAQRKENDHILKELQVQKTERDAVAKSIAANEPFPQGNANHNTPNLRELRESMRNPNLEKAAKGFGVEEKMKGDLTERFDKLFSNFASIPKESERHAAIRETVLEEVDNFITRLESNKDFSYGQDRVELKKFYADRPRIVSEITKQFEEALKAKTLGEKMNPKWGNPEYVDRIMGTLYKKIGEKKQTDYKGDGTENMNKKAKKSPAELSN
ncbi:MAG: hypothetical protein PHH70_03235 [Candidatus Gracilibacteria bacterium]|nr:hypothetical protein [Candidatus Gracilibacteria bacterium]